MLRPFDVRKQRFQIRFQRFGVGIAVKAIVRIKIHVAQMGQTHVMARRARGGGIGFGQCAVQRGFGGVSVQDENTFWHGLGLIKLTMVKIGKVKSDRGQYQI